MQRIAESQAGARVSSDRETPRACPACGMPRSHVRLYNKCGCAIWQCASCGLGRAEAAGFDPAAFYTGGYFTGAHSDGYADYPAAESVLRREFARTAAFIAKQQGIIARRGRLLDIGCAYGYFLLEAQRYFDVAGIELAEEAAEHCRRSGLNVLSGMADEANMERLGTFDIITLLDVIEHLPSPHDTLAICRRHLAPGGLLVLTTGDFASALARFMGARWRLMTPPQHLWFFTPESMRRLSGSLGYTLESCDHPAKIVPLGLMLFQLGRILGASRRAKPFGNAVGIPVNLYDAMRVVLRRPA